jgi:hypothetical protein
MPVVICRRLEFKWGLNKRGDQEQIYLNDIRCFEHYIMCFIYVMFGTKGLSNVDVK